MTLLELARRLDTGALLEAEIIVLDPGRKELTVIDAYIGLEGRVVLRTQHRHVPGWLTVAEEASSEK